MIALIDADRAYLADYDRAHDVELAVADIALRDVVMTYFRDGCRVNPAVMVEEFGRLYVLASAVPNGAALLQANVDARSGVTTYDAEATYRDGYRAAVQVAISANWPAGDR